VPISELDEAILRRDLPDEGLRAGDVGVVVHAYASGRAYEVEFMTADGDTVAVVTLDADDVEPLAGRRILHARPLTAGQA
jgi:hypothetical protein